MKGKTQKKKNQRAKVQGNYVYGTYTGPQCMVVQQVVGEGETQKSLDICVIVPRRKPLIEQVIDVFVKRLRITCVDVVTDKVIIRGDFELKVLYTACKPAQPVHAMEVRSVRFTAGVDICGARCGMDADANVKVEFIDYDCEEYTRAQWYKNFGQCGDHSCCDAHDACGHHKHHEHPQTGLCPSYKKPRKCARKCNVAVVLKITAKVLTNRQVMINPGLPYKPKG
ncbi:MAG TPA: DUF3794 domain-containing protein [Methylomusa anaerophila]|uniref:SipL SPOCS domain-containing protein n=1 Tax=Methylomusa anaerophila TaxID=1930071 RepID=A0A348AM99_9FIRM|nr:DUF3794 domain-containing protein [Methylomusa anaerophila]BBB92197.1 hypothetical protein MAMMFC1_02882 [Methylomusa anaerophila]HML87789.1 DUF3794 domain-containing protein [Methylomusa anaerophila]